MTTSTEPKTNTLTDTRKNNADKPLERTGLTVAKLALAALKGSPEPWALIEPSEGIVMFANDAAEALFQRRKSALIGASVSRIYPQDRGSLYVFTEEALYRGHAVTRDLTLLRPDGKQFRLEHTGIHVRDNNRSLLFLRIANLDEIEERTLSADMNALYRKGAGEWIHAAKFFHDLERDNQLILSAVGEGIYGVNAEGITTFLNPAAEKMLGYEAAELIGQEMHTAVHHTKADGSDYPLVDCPIYNAFRQRTVKTVDDEVFWCKSGKPLPVEYTSTPIVDEDIVVGAVIVFRDISQRKNDEARLRNLLADNASLRQRLELENAYLQEEIRGLNDRHNIIGSSVALQQTLDQIDLVADTNANVMIYGESGTGKELVAHAIHQASSRNERPLIRVNCAAIPRELFESEFFGHVKGAFSGATRDRVGRFELADGGTIFLDEIGEIPLDLQSKLLRVLQDKRFERVGEERTREVDVRLIGATNRDLEAEVATKRFREDLFFRINVFPIECRPLRERSEDIPLLAEHFLEKISLQLNLAKPSLTRNHVKTLQGYRWPGNVRELQNVIERAAIVARNRKLTIDLPQDTTQDGTGRTPIHNRRRSDHNGASDKVLTATELVAFERNNIRKALKLCSGKVSGVDGAAKLLDIKPTTLYSKIKSLGL